MEPETLPTDSIAPGAASENPMTPEEQAKAAQRTQTYIIIGVVAVVVLLLAFIIIMASFPTFTTVLRDIAIVFVALETLLIGGAMLVLVVQLQTLIQMLRDEVQPLLRSVNDTATTVRGTTQFVSHNMVSPIIKVAGDAAAARQMTSSLMQIIKGFRPRAKSKYSAAAAPSAPLPTVQPQSQTGGRTDEQTRE